MKIDLYTKSVLTVIAFSLVAIVIQNAISDAHASGKGIQKVMICDPLYDRCARVADTKVGKETVDVLLTVNVTN
jgi:hypothetical protein